MHYGNKEQLESNYLDIVLYKHGVICSEEERPFVVGLTSIQDCKYVNPWTLKRFLKNNVDWDNKKFTLNDILSDDKYSKENYYLVRLRFTGKKSDYEIVDIKKLDWQKFENPFYGLH